MNFPRVAAAAGAGLLAYLGLGALIHGVVLADLSAALQTSGMTRSPGSMTSLAPVGIAGAAIGALAFAYAYAKGYEGGPGLQEGLRFGVLVGFILVGLGTLRTYLTFNLPTEYLASVAVANIIQFATVGMVVGMIYRPRTRR